MNPYYGKLSRYVLSAVELAHSVRSDLAKDGVISNESMLHLATFIKHSHEVNALLDLLLEVTNKDAQGMN